jgi:hypothetical protein
MGNGPVRSGHDVRLPSLPHDGLHCQHGRVRGQADQSGGRGSMRAVNALGSGSHSFPQTLGVVPDALAQGSIALADHRHEVPATFIPLFHGDAAS